MQFTRINNDVNGNPRYVTHFLNIPINKFEGLAINTSVLTISEKYALACKKANKIGGRKYHTKTFGGGIVFQSYNLENLIESINNI
jgi:hypothetical protein